MNNNCMIATHAQRKIITFCLNTKCQGNRICCSMCQTEFHQDHFDQLLDCDFLLNFIESQVQQPNDSFQVGQILTELSLIQNNLAGLTKQTQLEIDRLSSSNLQQFCKNIGIQQSNLKNKFENFSNCKWNDLLENMLSYVKINNSQILEKSPFSIYHNRKEDSNFINQSTLIASNVKKSFKVISSIIKHNEKNSEHKNYYLQSKDNRTFSYGVDLCKQRSLLAFGTDDSTVRLCDLANNNILLKTYSNSGLVYDVIFSNSGNMLAFGGSGDYIIKFIDIQDLQKEQEVTELRGHNYTIRKLVFSQDSTYLISGSDDKSVIVWNLKTKKQSFKLISDCQIKSIAISKENSFLASYLHDEQIRIWRIQDQKLMSSQPVEVQRAEINFLDDKSIAISSGYSSARKILMLRQQYQGIKRINYLLPFLSELSFIIFIAIAVFILMRIFLRISGFTINGPSQNSIASFCQSSIQYDLFKQLFGILQSTAMGSQNYLIIFSIMIGIVVQVIVQLSQFYMGRNTKNKVINI